MRFYKHVIAVVLILLSVVINFTAYGDESEPFTLIESTPANNAASVDLNPEIKLLFNKNVVNFSVKDNNAKCFKLTGENGQTVDIDIVFPDDQIEPDKKREIYIETNDALKENTKYTLEISKDMLAKNGTTLGETVYISFTTIALTTNNNEQSVAPVIEHTPPKEEAVEEVATEEIVAEEIVIEEVAEEPAEEQENEATDEQEVDAVEETVEEVKNEEVSEVTSNEETEPVQNVSTDVTEVNETKHNNMVIMVAAVAVIAGISIIFVKRRS